MLGYKTKLKQFKGNEAKRNVLKELLSNPVMTEALALVNEDFASSEISIPGEEAAKRHYVQCGAKQLIEQLEELTESNSEIEEINEIEPYGHITK